MSVPSFPAWLVDVCTGVGAAALTLWGLILIGGSVAGVRNCWRRRPRRADTRAVVETAEQLTREAAR